jgi:hypothetical protein
VGAAEQCIREFNAMYVQLTEEQQKEYYNSQPAQLKDYQQCVRCGKSYKQMELVDAEDSAVNSKLRGQTLQTVLFPDE